LVPTQECILNDFLRVAGAPEHVMREAQEARALLFEEAGRLGHASGPTTSLAMSTSADARAEPANGRAQAAGKSELGVHIAVA
jgi:hypothetical protein